VRDSFYHFVDIGRIVEHHPNKTNLTLPQCCRTCAATLQLWKMVAGTGKWNIAEGCRLILIK
jgi:hypothetical protein